MTVQRVVVVGQGYVGLPLAMQAVEAGFDVVGLDTDERKVKQLVVGEPYVGDVDEQRLMAALDSGRYRPSLDYVDATGFDVCVITVPTPLHEGVPDLTSVREAGRAIAPLVRHGATVILESTTYPGTTEELLRPLLEEGSGLRAGLDFFLGYSPERVDPGNQQWRLENTPKVVSGLNAPSLARVQEFYECLVARVVPVSSTRVAELTKLLENTFRHVNIAMVNELAVVAEELEIDVWEAIDAASTKPFGYLRFLPGPGVGGHCLPIDPSYLSWHAKRRVGRTLRFVELANEINEYMPRYVAHRLSVGLNSRGHAVHGTRILLLGLAYKKNTGDVRESPSIAIARQLWKLGADLRAVEPFSDPQAVPLDIPLVGLTSQEVSMAQATVVLTDHDIFDYSLIERVAPYVFDTRNRCRGSHVERL